MFCAVDNVGGAGPVEYLPSSWKGVAMWFGVTAFLFCVHSMVKWAVVQWKGREGGKGEGVGGGEEECEVKGRERWRGGRERGE